MNRKSEKAEKTKVLLVLLLILTFGVGLGYAYLSEQLKVDSSVNYGSMKWNIGFTEATNGEGTITASPSVSGDKKTVTVACDLGTSTKSETCQAEVKVTNDSTFKIKLSEDPTVTYNADYIESVKVQAYQQGRYFDITKDWSISANMDLYFYITITTKELSEDMLPDEGLSIPVEVTMDWVQEQ